MSLLQGPVGLYLALLSVVIGFIAFLSLGEIGYLLFGAAGFTFFFSFEFGFDPVAMIAVVVIAALGIFFLVVL